MTQFKVLFGEIDLGLSWVYSATRKGTGNSKNWKGFRV